MRVRHQAVVLNTTSNDKVLSPSAVDMVLNDVVYCHNENDDRLNALIAKFDALATMFAFIAEHDPEAIKKWEAFQRVRDRMLASAATAGMPSNTPSAASTFMTPEVAVTTSHVAWGDAK